ncbi:ribosomal RNA small subunit methyltransferase B [Peptoniphilus sp. ING2-D1G]|nr:ribosomal RNA small subunit methyltransferase B [Peptoniphilus sp. ING2-D1G]
MKNSRKLALLILNRVLNEGAFLNEELNILKNEDISIKDKNLISNLTKGTLKNKLLIDHIIKKYSKIRIKKIHTVILMILEMGAYQILFTDRVPDYSSINESVNLAKEFGNRGSAGFVNALLRNLSANKEDILKFDFYLNELKTKNIAEYLSVKYSHPLFFVESLLKKYDVKFVEELLISNNEEAPFEIRVNTDKISVDNFAEKLGKLNYKCEKTKISKNALKIKNPDGIFDTKFYRDGYFYVQDEGSILVSENSNIRECKTLLDLCAAPGGKSINLSLLSKSSDIISCDISNYKVNLIRENIQRLGLKNIFPRKNDATKLNDKFVNKFDFVLVDAPCSGFGLYRRKPEIRYNREYNDIKSLQEIQIKILVNALNYLNEKGNLTYSTCTWSEEENEHVVNSVIDYDKFEIIKTDGENFKRYYPSKDGTDGFTICRIKRK